MKIAIVDDELQARDIIEKYICEWADKNSELVDIYKYESSESFLFFWEENKDYDLLVLDIEMGKMNGMDLAREIRMQNEHVKIVFVTGYDEYMQYGYDVSALNYLIKPVNKEKLFLTFDRFKQQTLVNDETIVVNTENDIRKILTRDIVYVEANGHGSIIQLAMETLNLRESLGEMEKALINTNTIVKCHRAYLVNLRYVAAIQGNDIVLDNGDRIPVSRNKMKTIQQEFLKYYRRNGD